MTDSEIEAADEAMHDPAMLHKVIKAMLKANADTDYTQDSIEPGDGELSEFARQLDFYLSEGTTEGAFK